MTSEFAISFIYEALKVTLLISAPMLGFGLAVGLAVSIFQSVTQVQEITLTFIPKILAVVLALMIFFPWILQIMLTYTEGVFNNIPQMVR